MSVRLQGSRIDQRGSRRLESSRANSGCFTHLDLEKATAVVQSLPLAHAAIHLR
jgi:hypothetical protein